MDRCGHWRSTRWTNRNPHNLGGLPDRRAMGADVRLALDGAAPRNGRLLALLGGPRSPYIEEVYGSVCLVYRVYTD